ncbi:hypothetical protein Pelo_901 [Pelomyxa schiedti]|nr:hypothetical protein Pelo_901 [Pelomyxa schiedti]
MILCLFSAFSSHTELHIPTEAHSFQFGISPLLMGVTTYVQVLESEHFLGGEFTSAQRRWVDDSRFILVHDPGVWIRNPFSGEQRRLRKESVAYCYTRTANSKWFLELRVYGGRVLVVMELEGYKEVEVALPDDLDNVGQSHIDLNKYVSSQAVILVEHIDSCTGALFTFLVVDVAKNNGFLTEGMMSDEPTRRTHKRPRIVFALKKKDAVFVTKPSWLGDIVFHWVLVARDQFASLVVAAQFPARCGARSPARVLGTALLRQLWDDWVVGCQRVLVLDTWVSKQGDEEESSSLYKRCIFRFGISPLLMGVTTALQVVPREKVLREDSFEGSTTWIDESRCLLVKKRGKLPLGVWINNQFSGEKRCLRKESVAESRTEANSRWCLELQKHGGRVMITVTELEGYKEIEVALPDDIDPWKSHIALNKSVSSQAVILVEHFDSCTGAMLFTFLVVDLAKTFSSGCLQIVNRSTSAFPTLDYEDEWSVGNILVMQNKDAQNVIIVHIVRNHSMTDDSFLSAVHSDGAVEWLYASYEREIEIVAWARLYQISSSLFSVHYSTTERLDIWDANETSHPVCRSILRIPSNKFLVGGGFIIFLADRGNKQVITEASSGIIALSFGIDGWRFHELANITSFLWCNSVWKVQVTLLQVHVYANRLRCSRWMSGELLNVGGSRLSYLGGMMSDEPTQPTHKRPRIVFAPKKTTTKNAVLKVTKPSWLGDIVFHTVLVARDQFASLVVAAQFPARCGARSPARVLGTHLLRQLWDDWVVGCQRVFILDVHMVKEGYVFDRSRIFDSECDSDSGRDSEWVLFKIGVSPLLLGITTGLCAMRLHDVFGGGCDGWWIDENRICWLEREKGKDNEMWMRDIRYPDDEEDSYTQLVPAGKDVGASTGLCINGKWWVQLIKNSRILVITNLTEPEPLTAFVVLSDPWGSVVDYIGLIKGTSSQAVMLVSNLTSLTTSLVIFDIEQTYNTGTVQVITRNPCEFPPSTFEEWTVGNILVMHNKSGHRVIIMENYRLDHDDHEDWDAVDSLAVSIQPNGEAQKLCSQTKQHSSLTQISGNLFLLHHKIGSRLDIWDINSLASKQPVTCIPGVHEYFQALAGGGFVVFAAGKEDNERKVIQVMEPVSGIVSAAFEVKGWRIKELFDDCSFVSW